MTDSVREPVAIMHEPPQNPAGVPQALAPLRIERGTELPARVDSDQNLNLLNNALEIILQRGCLCLSVKL